MTILHNFPFSPYTYKITKARKVNYLITLHYSYRFILGYNVFAVSNIAGFDEGNYRSFLQGPFPVANYTRIIVPGPHNKNHSICELDY